MTRNSLRQLSEKIMRKQHAKARRPFGLGISRLDILL
jgi:hypothetical protein